MASQPPALASRELALPLWVWAGLHFYAPVQAKAASRALDVLSAMEYGDQAVVGNVELQLGNPLAPPPLTPGSDMKAEEANARLMLMAAGNRVAL